MSTKDKHEYFQKIAGRRLTRILEDLDALGGCANPATYAYNSSEIEPIILEIYKKVAEILQRLIFHSPYSGVPFRLQCPEQMELAGHCVRRGELASMTEVMEQLEGSSPSFAALEPIRNRYEAQFCDELCWNYPVFHDGHLGCILMPVQEGVLYLPYNAVDCEEYEQFDLQGAGLLTSDQLNRLLSSLRCTALESGHVLADIQAYGLVQEP